MQVELLQSQPVEQDTPPAQIKFQIIISSTAKLQTLRGFANIYMCNC